MYCAIFGHSRDWMKNIQQPSYSMLTADTTCTRCGVHYQVVEKLGSIGAALITKHITAAETLRSKLIETEQKGKKK